MITGLRVETLNDVCIYIAKKNVAWKMGFVENLGEMNGLI